MKETGDFDRALKVLNQALVLDHKHAPTISQKGELLFDVGKPQQSFREFKKCTSLEPWNLKCQIYKSLCNLNTGKYYQGVKDLTQKGKKTFQTHIFIIRFFEVIYQFSRKPFSEGSGHLYKIWPLFKRLASYRFKA